MQRNNVGLIFASNVKADDVGLFSSLLNLTNTQTNILSIQTPSEVDSTTIEIYSNGKDSDAGNGDFIGGSFLSVVNLDSESIQNEAILDIFKSLSTEPVTVKELSPNNYLIVIEPGVGIDAKTRSTVLSIIKNTSTRDDILSVVDSAMVQIADDEEVNVNVQSMSPAAAKPYPTPVHSDKPGSPSSNIDVEQIVETVYLQVLKKLMDNASDINGAILELGKNKEEVTENIVDMVIRKATEKLQVVAEKTEPVEPEITPAIQPADAAIESVIAAIEEPIKDVPKTTIYDDKVTLKSLVEGGCESDEDLFNLVLQNKSKLSNDDLESACYFNMYKYYKHNIKEDNSTRESMMRKIKAGL